MQRASKRNSKPHLSPQERNHALKLAAKVGLTEAARRLGLHRNTLRNWKDRKDAKGRAGLKRSPLVRASHPKTTPDDKVRLILDLALAHPSFGCYRLRKLLLKANCEVSTTTIQNILNRNGLGTKTDRRLALEAHGSLDVLSEGQADFVRRENPCFPKCNVRNQGPGWSLLSGSWKIRAPGSRDEKLVIFVLDAWTGYTFGIVTSPEGKRIAIQKLNQQISSFYKGWGCTVQAVYTFKDMGDADDAKLVYEDNHALLKRHLSQVVIAKDHCSCCLKRFKQIVTKEYFQKLPDRALSMSPDDLDQSLNQWLLFYNNERKHEGYPHKGRTPIQRFHWRPKNRSSCKQQSKCVDGPASRRASEQGQFGGDSPRRRQKSGIVHILCLIMHDPDQCSAPETTALGP